MIHFPAGFTVARLTKAHRRAAFSSGQPAVDDWLKTKALQNQEKELSVTRVLVADDEAIAGYYTMAMGQLKFEDLPADVAKKLPRRILPAALLAWFGIATGFQRRGLGQQLFAQALFDCHSGARIFPFVAVLLDSINEASHRFYKRFNFDELPGSNQLFLTKARLDLLMASSDASLSDRSS